MCTIAQYCKRSMLKVCTGCQAKGRGPAGTSPKLAPVEHWGKLERACRIGNVVSQDLRLGQSHSRSPGVWTVAARSGRCDVSSSRLSFCPFQGHMLGRQSQQPQRNILAPLRWLQVIQVIEDLLHVVPPERQPNIRQLEVQTIGCNSTSGSLQTCRSGLFTWLAQRMRLGLQTVTSDLSQDSPLGCPDML